MKNLGKGKNREKEECVIYMDERFNEFLLRKKREYFFNVFYVTLYFSVFTKNVLIKIIIHHPSFLPSHHFHLVLKCYTIHGKKRMGRGRKEDDKEGKG